MSKWLPVPALVAVGYLASGAGSGSTRLLVFWALMLAFDVVMITTCVAVTRTAGPGPARRFWRATTLCLGVFAIGDTGSALASLGYLPSAVGLAILQAGTMSGGYLIVLVTMLRHPVRWRSSRARLAFWLDTGTVAVGAAALSWYFAIDPGATAAQVVLALGTASVFALTIFAGARLTVSDDPPLTRPAALLLIGSVVVVAISSITLPMPDLGNVDRYQLLLPVCYLPSVVAITGLVVQYRHGSAATGPRRRTARRRSFSLLPYAMLAAVFGLLVASLPRFGGGGLDAQVLGQLSAAMLGVGLVVGRQLVSFTDNDRLLAQLAQQEQRMSALLEHSSDITAITDRELRLAYVSPAAERVLGYRPQALVGRSAATLVHPEDRARVEAPVAELLANPGRTHSHQARYRHADGSWRWLEVITTNLIDAPYVGGLISNCREITAARELQDLLQYQATHDPLTQLANRLLFAERLDETLQVRGGRHDAVRPFVSVLLVDLDDFKHINDSIGHHAGDQALISLAERLVACVRHFDTAARLGGDEFAVLLPNTSAAEATLVAERLLAHTRAYPVEVDGREFHLSLSIGIATSTVPDVDAVLRQADAAMYQAKQGGKNRYAVHDAVEPVPAHR